MNVCSRLRFASKKRASFSRRSHAVSEKAAGNSELNHGLNCGARDFFEEIFILNRSWSVRKNRDKGVLRQRGGELMLLLLFFVTQISLLFRRRGGGCCSNDSVVGILPRELLVMTNTVVICVGPKILGQSSLVLFPKQRHHCLSFDERHGAETPIEFEPMLLRRKVRVIALRRSVNDDSCRTIENADATFG